MWVVKKFDSACLSYKELKQTMWTKWDSSLSYKELKLFEATGKELPVLLILAYL